MASGAIRGITVEIGGDTTKLGKAIGDSEKKSRSLQTELRQVEKLLQFDPTNVELLTQKQNILADTISETAKKLDTLKAAEAQVVAQFERGEIGEEQLRAFQREIMQTEKSLSDMREELRTATRNLDEFGDNNGVAREAAEKLEKEIREQNEALEAEKKALQEAEEAHKKHEKAVDEAKETLSEYKETAADMAGAVATGAAAVGAAAVAGAGYALNLSTEFDKAFNTLTTRTGASADEMDGLNEAMENVYANNFGENIQDVAESMATVRNNTKLTGDQLQETTEYALLMRDTFEFDVNESTRSAKMLMDHYGISAKEAYNLIAQGAQNGLDKNGDLLDTINEYTVHFSNLGIDAESMFNMLINGAENGTFSVDKLGDAVKEFGIRVIDGSETTAAGFDAIGLDADEMASKFAAGGDSAADALNQTVTALFNMSDPIAQNTAGVNLFGTMWEDLGADGVKALMDVSGECSRTSTALDDINNTKYDDIGSAVQGLGRTLQTELVEPIGDELKPVVEDAIEYVQANAPQIKEVLSNIVQKVGEFVGFVVDNGSAILSVITGIGAGMLVWNVASMITGVVNAIKAFKLANEGATVAQWLMNAAMNANPIGILVTVIAAVVTAIVTFIATNEDARNKIVEIWNKIQEVFGVVIDALVNFFTVTVPAAVGSAVAFFQALPGKIQAAISNLVSIVQNIFTNVKNTISSIAQNIYDSLPAGFQLVVQNVQTIIQNFVTIFENYFNIIKTVVQTAISVVKAIFTGDFASIPDIVSGALEKIRGFFANIFDAAETIVINWIAAIINYFRGWGETIVSLFKLAGEKISAWWDKFEATCTEKAKAIISAVVTFFKELPGKLYNAIVAAIDRVKAWGDKVTSTAKNAAKSMINGVVTFAKELPGKIYNAISGAISKVSDWGSKMLSTAKSKMSEVVRGIVNTVKDLPSRFVEIGRNIIEGIKNGIGGAISGLYNSIKSKLSGLVDKAKDALGINSPSKVFAEVVGKAIPEGIAKGVDDNTDLADDAVQHMTDDLTSDVQVNGATINRKLTHTFGGKTPGGTAADNKGLLDKLDRIYERLTRLQIVLDTGTLVGETIDKVDAALAEKQLLSERGV